MAKIILLIAVLVLELTQFSFSASNGAGTAVSFLQLPMGARIAALGNAGTGVLEGVLGTQINPASISGITQQEVSFSRIQHVEGVSFNFLGYGAPIPTRYRKVYFGATILHGTYGEIDRTEVVPGANTGTKTGTFSGTDIALGLTASARVFSGLSAGLNVKYLRESFAESNANGASFDVGAIYEIRQNGGMSVGMTVRHIGKGLKLDQEQTPLPTSYNIGVSGLVLNNIFLAMDLEKRLREDTVELRVGSEYRIGKKLALRAGSQGAQDPTRQLSFGVGWNVKMFTLDYALMPFGDFGNTHRITLTGRFGK